MDLTPNSTKKNLTYRRVVTYLTAGSMVISLGLYSSQFLLTGYFATYVYFDHGMVAFTPSDALTLFLI
jgi:hypothetical protein